MASVSLSKIVKRYAETTVIPSLDLEVDDGEFMVLVGPSGCGKTTSLRMVAGLERTSGGSIRIAGRDVTGLRPGLRNCAMVFQNYALYPHMNVRDNITYGLRVRRTAPERIGELLDEAVRILGLQPYLDRRPRELSGGQQQRVAIGRAIVREPDVFLFDEPLSNLDAKLRVEMRTELKQLHRRLGNTMIYVTHDQIEAMTLADRVCVMNEGRIEQLAPPLDLYQRPVNRFVASFIGTPSMNFVDATGEGSVARLADGVTVETNRPLPAGPVVLGLRPEDMEGAGDERDGTFSMMVREIEPLGPGKLLIGELGGSRFVAQVDTGVAAELDRPCAIRIQPSRIHGFDASSGRRLAS
ncbi:MAG: sn-glycerol-3-phosphate ABC transporter ATP-binding protein UgpC [Geminicoccaceae bacterium]|nr:sn-glycerol-3-phosphate ABC transporter ATP-binding protein UgpC [Geminicoccaceae bacterium]